MSEPIILLMVNGANPNTPPKAARFFINSLRFFILGIILEVIASI